MEPLLSYAGPHGAMFLLLIVPLLWDIPTILMVLEMNSMMPVNGGYYQWVKRGLGLRWGFYEGWWTWLYTFVDLAIYPVLFVQYAAFFIPGLEVFKIPICLAIIWSCAGLNILGVMPVGKASMVLGTLVFIPFLLLFAAGNHILFGGHHLPGAFAISSHPLRGLGFSSIGMGIYTVMWNMLGWDNTTTYAEEVEKPARSYLISVSMAFALILLLYVLTLQTARGSGIDPASLRDNGFPALGSLVGGHWLAVLLAAGGMASSIGLFAGVLLSVSQVPKVMADDRLLPERVSALHTRYNTPYISIVICATVVSVMILWSFMDLIIIDINLYWAAVFLEFIALVAFRIKAPQKTRPFRIPLNITGICLLVVLPVGVYALALSGALFDSGEAWKPALFALGALLTAEIAWLGVRCKKNRVEKIDYI
jgi:amino acid transporter